MLCRTTGWREIEINFLIIALIKLTDLYDLLLFLNANAIFFPGYDGPMQFMMSPVNPDQVIPLQTNRISTYDGKA